MKEIGGEFWLDTIRTEQGYRFSNWLHIGDDIRFLFSGRTAIDYVLEDVRKEIRSVYMPSYCCYSMLQPFLDRGIQIDFYDVVQDNTVGPKFMIDRDKSCDIFFATSYFGFSCTSMDSEIAIFSNKDVIVIEDTTHRLLSEQSYCRDADYSIASLRKWLPLPSGGLAVKRRGKFHDQVLDAYSPLLEIKLEAMRRKADYLNFCKGDKQAFLSMFSEFDKGLKCNYRGIEMDSLSRQLLSAADITYIKNKRRENAQFLYESFENHLYVKPLISAFAQEDCPLFFPIRVKPETRASLRSYLIKNEIYCPVHWPFPNEVSNNPYARWIYDEELSLVCDQRYDIDDMERIRSTIGEFYRIL